MAVGPLTLALPILHIEWARLCFTRVTPNDGQTLRCLFLPLQLISRYTQLGADEDTCTRFHTRHGQMEYWRNKNPQKKPVSAAELLEIYAPAWKLRRWVMPFRQPDDQYELFSYRLSIREHAGPQMAIWSRNAKTFVEKTNGQIGSCGRCGFSVKPKSPCVPRRSSLLARSRWTKSAVLTSPL